MSRMEIQWSLVIFTTLAGTGAWLFAFLGLGEVRGRHMQERSKFTIALTALVLLAVGGIASVTHLSHPDRIMGALGHPTMGIFAEAAFLGVVALLIVVYLVLLKRKASTRLVRGFAFAGGALAVVLSFVLGYSYMMASRVAWNTISLPAAYLGTAMSVGAACFVVLLCVGKEKGSFRFGALILLVSGIVSTVASVIYGFLSGAATGETAALFWVLAVVCGGVVPAACGCLSLKKPDQVMTFGMIALVMALCGCIGFRCVMWMVGEGLNYFGYVI